VSVESRAAGAATAEANGIGARYVVQRTLGHGGMAVVYEVNDLASGKALALKRLERNPDPMLQRRNAQLFEREYERLSQLAHPRVVQVFDYALDADGPYYTMELLDGGDVQGLAPMPWRKACVIGRDICSALSLLHSRQLVHRDISPRNVRCASDGTARLIDFGVMCDFGPSKLVVGTPPCCAPEVVAAQALDARTDLYALGATLYFALVGRHAYPAGNFAMLAELWRESLARPSQLVEDIPEALDALVLSLLRLDPDARPGSAAEVMLRLSAIDGCAVDEGLLVAQSYLSTPMLVGRSQQLARAQLKIKRVQQARASALAILGPSGVGRTRFLEACVLEATLLGMTVVRVTADHAQTGEFGLVRSIASELLTLMPDVTLNAARPALALLQQAVPELLAHEPEVAPEPTGGPGYAHGALQAALRQWLLRVSAHKPLLIAIDDLQRVDDASATLLALLAHELRDQTLSLVASIETGVPALSDTACKLFIASATKLALDNLSAPDTELLLRSLFGAAPNVDLVAHRLWQLAAGNPRTVMRLAQHLVDTGVVRYRAGTWTLPLVLAADELPVSASDAQLARLAAQSPAARELASGLALCPDLTFSREDCAILSGRAAESGEVAALLEALRRAEVIRVVREGFTLGHPTWGALLRAELTPEAQTRLHARLAASFARRPDQVLRVGQHLLLAGEIDRGLDVLVQHASTSQEDTAQAEVRFFRYVRSLPPDWLQVFHDAVRLCSERGRPRRQRFQLLSRLVGILAALAVDDQAHVTILLGELQRDSGLADWAALDPALAGMPRLTKALEQVQARYDAASEQERVLDPLTAIKMLARSVIASSAMASMTLDVQAVRALPSLVPLIPLSPALAAINLLIEGMSARYSGRPERARELYLQLLERTAGADRGGLDASHAGFLRLGVMNTLGMIDASVGLASSLAYAEQLDTEPSHRVNALRIRMLYQLWQGDSVEAERCKRDVDRVRIENSGRQWFEGAHLLWEVTAYSLSEDLIRIRQTREEMAPLVGRYKAWVALDHYAAAQYQRACGDYASALKEIELALSLTAAGEHPGWVQMATTKLQALAGLGREDEAHALGEAYLARALETEQGIQSEHLRMALSLIRAKQGNVAGAIATADEVIERLSAAGVSGLLLGLAYETRARVSLYTKDNEGFGQFASLCRPIYYGRKNQALTAKYEKLMRDARRDGPTRRGGAVTPNSAIAYSAKLISALESCRTPEMRANVALTLLLEHSRTEGGFLFVLGQLGPTCVARAKEAEPSDAIIALVRSYVAQELGDESITTGSEDEPGMETTSVAATWREANGSEYRPLLLTHYADGKLIVSAVAVLRVGAATPFVHPGQVASDLSRYGIGIDSTQLTQHS
jgi:serine/threonine-protein kinase